MNQDRRQNNNLGFTLVELMLAMVFISILLISITLLVLQISNIYNRGITLREVDTTGRSIAEQFRRDLAQQASFGIGSSNYLVDVGTGSGRLCTGRYSYVWNYAKELEDNVAGLNKYSDGDRVIKLIKINDQNAATCQKNASGVLGDIEPDKDRIVDLISADGSLALHGFSISRIAYNDFTKEGLYRLSFTLGTMEQDLIDANNGLCKPPKEGSRRDFSYCAINNFDIIVKANSAK